jgi:hypothetical protein
MNRCRSCEYVSAKNRTSAPAQGSVVAPGRQWYRLSELEEEMQRRTIFYLRTNMFVCYIGCSWRFHKCLYCCQNILLPGFVRSKIDHSCFSSGTNSSAAPLVQVHVHHDAYQGTCNMSTHHITPFTQNIGGHTYPVMLEARMIVQSKNEDEATIGLYER